MSLVKKLGKIAYILVILTLMFTFLPLNKQIMAESTGLIVSVPSVILEGQSVVFTVQYNSNVKTILLSEGDIILNGFTATKYISGSGNKRTVTLKNISGTGDNKSITIAAGSAILNDGSKTKVQVSNTFKIKPAITQTTPSNNTSSNNNASNNNTSNNANNENTNNNQANNSQSSETNNNETSQNQSNTEETTNNTGRPDDWVPNPNTGK